MRKLLILITLSSFALTLSAQTWGDINYDGAPWVDNVSRPYKISKGLSGPVTAAIMTSQQVSGNGNALPSSARTRTYLHKL